MHAYLAEEGLARFCTEPYQKPSNENMSKTFMHLTNYSINKAGHNWIDESEVDDMLKPNNCSKRTITALFQQLE